MTIPDHGYIYIYTMDWLENLNPWRFSNFPLNQSIDTHIYIYIYIYILHTYNPSNWTKAHVGFLMTTPSATGRLREEAELHRGKLLRQLRLDLET